MTRAGMKSPRYSTAPDESGSIAENVGLAVPHRFGIIQANTGVD